jgi:hypothetical protein
LNATTRYLFARDAVVLRNGITKLNFCTYDQLVNRAKPAAQNLLGILFEGEILFGFSRAQQPRREWFRLFYIQIGHAQGPRAQAGTSVPPRWHPNSVELGQKKVAHGVSQPEGPDILYGHLTVEEKMTCFTPLAMATSIRLQVLAVLLP